VPTIRLEADPAAQTLVLPVRVAASAADTDEKTGRLAASGGLDDDTVAEVTALLTSAGHTGAAGAVEELPRPLRTPSRVVLVGVGDGDDGGWRCAGAAAARARGDETSITFALPDDIHPGPVRALVEGVLLGAYRFRLASPAPGDRPPLAELALAVPPGTAGLDAAVRAARITADATVLARDLSNMPSADKTPQWMADQVGAAAAGHDGLTMSVREPEQLAAEGFGGILAVGGGSTRGPRLVELRWEPPDATRHVVLVGKGITFDTGGISIKPRDAMKLMRKDMSGAAAVLAATVGAAVMRLPVRVTALAPLAENMVSGSAYRPGDVIRHYGGRTSESTNSDAEGRLVLADALAYAVAELSPDVIVDLATLTGANAVALGKRTAALYAPDASLAAELASAAEHAGEQVWRMPLPADYLRYLDSDIADLHSSPTEGAGSVVAALYLGEFTGPLRDRWAHIDMSAPSWVDADDRELSRGATGWGVRTLLRWLEE
jgi:leucyl aminopeptidase